LILWFPICRLKHNSMLSFPNAKINLGLNILRKRSDGFHEIETCMLPLHGFTDILEIIAGDNTENGCKLSVSGILPDGDISNNLCYKAYDLLHKHYSLHPVEMHLHKCIPMGAGLGGGSADAAFTLRLLNDMFSLAISVDVLTMLAAELGSDCAFFIENKPAIATGRGEILKPCDIHLSGYYLLLALPAIHVTTATAYQLVVPKQTDIPLAEVLKCDVGEWKSLLVNDFEPYVFLQYPELRHIKNTLYDAGAVYASMSGSGSAVFGLFREPPKPESIQISCKTKLMQL